MLKLTVPVAEVEMRNPWNSKNPFMSAWLSSANKIAGSARAQATAQTKRQAASIQTETAKQIVDFWTGKTAAAAPKKKRR